MPLSKRTKELSHGSYRRTEDHSQGAVGYAGAAHGGPVHPNQDGFPTDRGVADCVGYVCPRSVPGGTSGQDLQQRLGPGGTGACGGKEGHREAAAPSRSDHQPCGPRTEAREGGGQGPGGYWRNGSKAARVGQRPGLLGPLQGRLARGEQGSQPRGDEDPPQPVEAPGTRSRDLLEGGTAEGRQRRRRYVPGAGGHPLGEYASLHQPRGRTEVERGRAR